MVPLAPVGPPNLVRLSQACHGLVRQKWGFMCGGMAHACETLERGGFLACRQRPEVKCSLLVRYPTQNQDPLFLPGLLKDPHSTDRESGDHSAVGNSQAAVDDAKSSQVGNSIVVHSGPDLNIFSRSVQGQAKKTWPKELKSSETLTFSVDQSRAKGSKLGPRN